MAQTKVEILQFASSATSVNARVHPVVLFNICDCYVRRPDQSDRVIGTLLGSVSSDGTVEIQNSYAVPHSESSDQVSKIYWFSSEFFIFTLKKFFFPLIIMMLIV